MKNIEKFKIKFNLNFNLNRNNLFKNTKELKNNPYLILLISILIIAAFFQFYNFPYRYILGDESVRDALIGIHGASNLQLPLTGAFSSAGPFTFGPWFYYQLIFSSLITPNYNAPWIYMSLMVIFSVLILYKIGEELESKKLGLILAFLGLISPALIISGLHLSNPNALNFWALLCVYIFIRMINRNVTFRSSLLFGFILGVSINIHYQAIPLLIMPFILYIYKYRSLTYIIYFFFGLFVTFIPLFIFDLNSNWFNLKNMLYYFVHGKDAIYVPNRWLFYLRDFWPAFWGDTVGVIKPIAGLIIFASITLVIFKLINKKINRANLLLLFVFGILFIAMRYYWGERFFGYFVFLRPFIFIFTGYLIYSIFSIKKWGNIIGSTSMIVLFVLVSPIILNLLSPNQFTKEMYNVRKDLSIKYPSQRIDIYVCAKASKGNDQSVQKSLLFLQSKEKNYSSSVVKLGLKSDVRTLLKPDNCTIPYNIYMTVRTTNIDFIDLSLASDSSLKKNGWEKITIKSLYDNTVRWWYLKNENVNNI